MNLTSLREIGRQVAAEVEQYFETEVKPGTIKSRALRMQKAGSNEPPKENPVKSRVKKEIKQIKRAKDGTWKGGARKGSGRKAKDPDEILLPLHRMHQPL